MKVRQINYVQRKKDSLVSNERGEEYIHFVVATDHGRENYYLKDGETQSIGGMLI